MAGRRGNAGLNRPSAKAVIETAEVVDLDDEGRGVARVQGKAVFITDALPGEQVEFVRLRQHRNFDEARLQSIVTRASDRVEPPCEHFGVCGGCALQHLAPERQIEFKERQLLQALTRIGQVAPAQVLPPLRGGSLNYRRRARLGVRWVPKKNRALVGFRERNSKFLADIRRCWVLKSPADQLVGALSDLITTLQIRDRLPQIELSVADNATALVFRVLSPPGDADLEKLQQFGRDHQVQIFLQPRGYDSIFALAPPVAPLTYRLPEFAVELIFEPFDFVQIHGALNEQMVSQALRLLELRPEHRVLDLFCGLGNFSLPLARRAADVVGVEGESGLVERARANAIHNGLQNVNFVTANLFEAAQHGPWSTQRFDRVLIDPPRAGAREILPWVAQCGASRVVYVSCHPGSLARDAGILVKEHGFRLVAAGVMDMFAHTTHVESMAVFERE